MKIAHINFEYGTAGIGGASVAASRLHNEMLDAGLDSHFFCLKACEVGQKVVVAPRSRLIRWLYAKATKVLRHLPRLVGAPGGFSQNLIPSGIGRKVNRLNPDVVVLHWIAGDTIAFREIGNIKAPMVVYFHDFWLITGNGHHFEDGDRRYIEGYSKENSKWWELKAWRRKRKLLHKVRERLMLVAPSEWALKVVYDAFGGDWSNYATISNPIDTNVFKLQEQDRKSEKVVLIFGANGGRKNRFKGFSDLECALEMIPPEVTNRLHLLIFGEMAGNYSINGVTVEFLGSIESVQEMAAVYNRADIFLFPSVKETQGQTKVEAMACGLPVVAFDRSACAEGIEHKINGWIAKDGDLRGYAEGIIWWVENKLRDRSFGEMVKQNVNGRLGNSNADSVIKKWVSVLSKPS